MRPVRLLFIPALLCSLLVMVLTSCKPSTPHGVMSESKLEDVLYDYNLALAMADNEPAKTQDEREQYRYQYVQKVFERYGITEEYFDSTMVWYSAEGERLQKIFVRINERFDAEAKSLGVDLSETEIYANYTADGDTANVWNGDRILYLSNYQPDNVKVINLPVDSTYLPGDTYKFSFNAHFLPSQGMHSAYVMFSVYYKDKSVRSQVQTIGGDYRSELNLIPTESQDTLLPERLVITLYAPPISVTSRFQLFYITYPAVLRMHDLEAGQTDKKDEDIVLEGDTLGVDSSAVQTDTVTRRLSPLEERDNREVEHSINIVKERIVRPAGPARVRRRVMR